jgi:hypothetical protein
LEVGMNGMNGKVNRRWLVAGVAFVLLVTLAYGVSRWELGRRKQDLRAAVAREHAALPERPRALVDAMDDVVLEAAAEPWPGDLGKPDATLFGKTMLYLRAAVPEIARLDAIGASVRRSEKDTFALCAVKPPASEQPDDVHAAATRYWLGGALFEDATHDVLPLHAVHAGLRPLSHAFATELDEADDHLSIRRLEEEYDYRRPLTVALARTAADAELLVVVADELPPDMPAPEVGRGLTATRRPAILPSFEDKPHVVRVLVWSAAERKVVLRLRAPVDARTRPSSRRPEAVAEMHGCQAAIAARGCRSACERETLK